METDSPDDSNSSNTGLFEADELKKRQQQEQQQLQHQQQQQQHQQEHMQPSSSSRFVPPLPPNRPLCGVPRTMLYSGSHFHGSQKSRGNCYDVEVILQYVDLDAGRLCGYLIIKVRPVYSPSLFVHHLPLFRDWLMTIPRWRHFFTARSSAENIHFWRESGMPMKKSIVNTGANLHLSFRFALIR